MLGGGKVQMRTDFGKLMPSLSQPHERFYINMVKAGPVGGPLENAYEVVGVSVKGPRNIPDNSGIIQFRTESLRPFVNLKRSEAFFRINQLFGGLVGLFPSSVLLKEFHDSGYIRKDLDVVYVPANKLIIPSMKFPGD